MATKNEQPQVIKRPNFRGFEHMQRGFASIPAVETKEIPKDGLLTAIFAPDPATGMPRSDLHIQLSGSLDPTTQEYIRRSFAQPLPDSVGHEDPDVVLDGSRQYGENVDQYIERLQKMVKGE